MAQRGAQVVAARSLLVRERGAQYSQYYGTPGYRHLRGAVGGYRYLPTRYLPDGRAVVTIQRGWGN